MLSDRQQQIIEESIKIISEKGIQGFTIKNLSKAIGISEPAIYRHFSSKVDILATILNQFVEMASFLSEMMESSEMKAFEKLEFMFSKMVDIFTENPAMISVIFSEEIFKNEEKLEKITVGIMNKNEQTIENIIKKGQENNELRNDIDEKNLALMTMGALRLMVKRWDLNKHQFNLKSRGQELISSIKILTVK